MRRNARREQAEHKQSDTGLASLEAELHEKQGNRQDRRADARTAARAEAESIARVTGQHFRSRPTGSTS